MHILHLLPRLPLVLRLSFLRDVLDFNIAEIPSLLLHGYE